MVKPASGDQLVLNTSLTTDNITSVVATTAIPGGTPADGYILLWDDLGNYRRLHYSSFASDTFTIDTTDGNEDFATVNASAPTAVWITDLDPGTTYQIDVTLNAFDMSEDENIKEVKTMGGLLAKSFYYSTRVYACATLKSVDRSEPTTAEYEMFLASVKGGETFTITNLDESDETISVQLIGAAGRSRLAYPDVGKFSYNFTVREEIA